MVGAIVTDCLLGCRVDTLIGIMDGLFGDAIIVGLKVNGCGADRVGARLGVINEGCEVDGGGSAAGTAAGIVDGR